MKTSKNTQMNAVGGPVVKPEPTENLGWTFLTNHTHILLCLYRDPESRIRDLADWVGITERMVQKILSELEAAGYISVEKVGRRNRYRLKTKLKLRHPLEAQHSIGEILAILGESKAKE
jgi:DNA-binding MarR family transcriptional regulator